MDNATNAEPVNILIVDDEIMIRDLLEAALERTSYQCQFAENGEHALQIFQKQPFDILLTDIDMPKMDGIELSKTVLSNYNTDIIVMTGQIRSYQYDGIVNIGVSDFVEKPFSPNEMILRINRVVRERNLKHIAQKAHLDLQESYIDSIHRLVMAAEYKDEDTGDHIIRIGSYCTLIAEKLGLSDEFIETIHYASPMHDIGKMGIPDSILLKPGKLTNVEFETIKTHTQIGARLLSRSKSNILQLGQEIALNHHEKFNGKGYPNRIKGSDIPISGRIVAIADTFDALTSKRPYKDPYPAEVTREILIKERGEQFDPEILDIFIANFDTFLNIRKKSGTYDDESLQTYVLSERDKIESKKIT